MHQTHINPNQIFQIGNGFGFFITFHYGYFENGRRRRASSKCQARSSAVTKKFRQSLIPDSDGIFLMRPLTDFPVPRAPCPQPFKARSFLFIHSDSRMPISIRRQFSRRSAFRRCRPSPFRAEKHPSCPRRPSRYVLTLTRRKYPRRPSGERSSRYTIW